MNPIHLKFKQIFLSGESAFLYMFGLILSTLSFMHALYAEKGGLGLISLLVGVICFVLMVISLQITDKYPIKINHPLYAQLHEYDKLLYKFSETSIIYGSFLSNMFRHEDNNVKQSKTFEYLMALMKDKDLVWLLKPIFEEKDVTDLLSKLETIRKNDQLVENFKNKPQDERASFLKPIMQYKTYFEKLLTDESFQYSELKRQAVPKKYLSKRDQKRKREHQADIEIDALMDLQTESENETNTINI